MPQKLKPSGKPVKPKKPLPAKEAPAKAPVAYGLTEERVREIARGEIEKCAKKEADALKMSRQA